MTSPMALEGIRILDLSRLLPGPYASQLLADLGADVIKVEEPTRGDYTRHYPLRLGDFGSHFAMLNRNKRSIALDLKKPTGRDALLRLAGGADVLLESFRPGVMDRLGVGYEAVRARNPGIIYCAISGYGQDGPYRLRPGHDVNYCALAGAITLSGAPEGDPTLQGCQLADVGGGALMSVMGILAALLARARTGEGQYVDAAMMDGTTSMLTYAFAEHFAASDDAPRRGVARLHGGRPGYGVYRCRDGRHVALGALEKKFWHRLCELVERPDLIERIAPATRDEIRTLRAELEAIFSTRDRDEWCALMADEDVCLTPVSTVAEATRDPQLRFRGMITKHEGIPQLAFPVRLSGTPASIRRRPPHLGEHTRDVLAEAGMSTGEIDAALNEGGAVQA